VTGEGFAKRNFVRPTARRRAVAPSRRGVRHPPYSYDATDGHLALRPGLRQVEVVLRTNHTQGKMGRLRR
jgi:hypothetical protein